MSELAQRTCDDKPKRARCESTLPRALLQLMLTKTPLLGYTTELHTQHSCCPDRDRSHFTSCSSLSPQMLHRLRPVYAFSAAELVSVERFTGEQSSNSIQPNGPSWPKHCGQLWGNWPLAQSPCCCQPCTGQPSQGQETGQQG